MQIFKRNKSQRIVVFGNSGSGKSTLAKNYTLKYGLAHLDLDVLAWLDTNPPSGNPLIDSATKIENFSKKTKTGLSRVVTLNCRAW